LAAITQVTKGMSNYYWACVLAFDWCGQVYHASNVSPSRGGDLPYAAAGTLVLPLLTYSAVRAPITASYLNRTTI